MGELLAAALVAFVYLRLLDEVLRPESATPLFWFLLRLFGGMGLAVAYMAFCVGERQYLAFPAYGAALLLHRLDGLMLAKSDESIHNIMKNRR